MVMEWLDRKTLETRLAREKCANSARSWKFAASLGLGLIVLSLFQKVTTVHQSGGSPQNRR